MPAAPVGHKGTTVDPQTAQQGLKMYMPENNAQLFDILAALRIYASLNALPVLAEALDDAAILLAAECEPAHPVLSSTGFDQV